MRPVANVGSLELGLDRPLAFIAGPCVIESRAHTVMMAQRLAELAARLEVPLIFKASFDKANRTSASSYRGPGLEKGLEILAEARERSGLPVVTDIHLPEQADKAAEVVDMLQIPAMLVRQTDLLLAAGATGKPVNLKKMQFLAPEDMRYAAEKVKQGGSGAILLCERGSAFGYRELVVDMRGLARMAELGYPVVFDATHSVQRPGAAGGRSGGEAAYAPLLARAAIATGAVSVLFFEVHDKPAEALSDGPNMLDLEQFEQTVRACKRLYEVVRTLV